MEWCCRFDFVEDGYVVVIGYSQVSVCDGFDVWVCMLEDESVWGDGDVVLSGGGGTGEMY